MASTFDPFGAAHLLILTITAASVVALVAVARRRASRLPVIRSALGLALAATALAWYGYLFAIDAVRFPDTLPLDLCDVALWVTVAAALTRNRSALEVAYFVGVGGSTMALLMPDLRGPLLSWPVLVFFLTHGLVAATPLVLIASGACRPRPGSARRVFVLANAYAAAVALFNVAFGTNYMYICRKPANPSLLDYFGPWPLYVIAGELFAALVFWALWLPFRRAADGRDATPR